MSVIHGTAPLLRLIARRDRWRTPIWLAAITGVLVLQVTAIQAAYGNVLAKTTYATVMSSSVPARLFGAPDGPTLGAITMVEIYGTLSIVVALMNTMGIVRHTRQSEENGRYELVGAAQVGRHAPLAAALLAALVTNIALALALTGVLVALGLPAAGATIMALALAGTGLVFAAIAAITAQVAPGARMANGLAGGVIGVMFLVRGIGTMIGDLRADNLGVVIAWPSWLSPMGWGELAYPFSHERWAVLALYPVAAILLTAVAGWLAVRRDLGAGMIPTRDGHPRASRFLTSPLGLALRLQRGLVIGWAAAMVLMGAATGIFANEIESMLADNDVAKQMFQAMGQGMSLTDSYFAIMVAWLSVMLTGYVAQAMLRLRHEEEAALEVMLAAPLKRRTWQLHHAAATLLGSVALLATGGLTSGVTAALVMNDANYIAKLLGASMVQLPALAVVIGLVVLAHGLAPGMVPFVAWMSVAVCVLALMGSALRIPEVILDLSPFTHLPLVPAEQMEWMAVTQLGVVAASLAALGSFAWSRRDLGARLTWRSSHDRRSARTVWK